MSATKSLNRKNCDLLSMEYMVAARVSLRDGRQSNWLSSKTSIAISLSRKARAHEIILRM